MSAVRQSRLLPLAGLYAIALVLRIAMIRATGFDGLYGQDPYAYYDYSLKLREALTGFQPPPPFFWPLGYPLLVVLGTILIGPKPLAGQMMSLLGGALMAPLIYLLVLEIRSAAKTGALVAGLLAAVASQLMISSLSIMSDAAGLAWATISALFLLRYARRQESRWLLLAAFTLGWAVLTRWVYGLLAVPWSLSVLLNWRSSHLRLRQQIALAFAAVLAGSVVVGAPLLFNLGSGELAHVGDLQTVGWDLSNAFRSTITNSDGAFVYERPIGLFYALPAIHPAFVLPLLTPFLLLGLWFLRRASGAQASLLLAWPLSIYGFLAGIAWENPRFALALFPPLVVLTGLGIHQAQQFVIQRFPAALGRSLLAAYLVVCLLGSLAWTLRDVYRFTAANQKTIDASTWLASQVPAEATVVTFGVTLTVEHRTSLDVADIYLLDAEKLSDLTSGVRPLYLFIDPVNIQSQWKGLSPELNMRWLQLNSTLLETGRFPPYTLYQVMSPVAGRS